MSSFVETRNADGSLATGEPSVGYGYDDWGEAVATSSEADGIVRTVSNLTANVIRDGEVWRETVATRGCSDQAIAPDEAHEPLARDTCGFRFG